MTQLRRKVSREICRWKPRTTRFEQISKSRVRKDCRPTYDSHSIPITCFTPGHGKVMSLVQWLDEIVDSMQVNKATKQ